MPRCTAIHQQYTVRADLWLPIRLSHAIIFQATAAYPSWYPWIRDWPINSFFPIPTESNLRTCNAIFYHRLLRFIIIKILLVTTISWTLFRLSQPSTFQHTDASIVSLSVHVEAMPRWYPSKTRSKNVAGDHSATSSKQSLTRSNVHIFRWTAFNRFNPTRKCLLDRRHGQSNVPFLPQLQRMLQQ